MTNRIWTTFDAATYDADQAERTAWFNKVAPTGNWKEPIDTWIRREDFADCYEAARFFTGAGLTVTESTENFLHIKGAGYYATVGA